MGGLRATRPAPDLPPGARLALVIATTSYRDPALRQLRAPAGDAADLAAVLADPGIGSFAVTSAIDRPAQEIRMAIEDFLTDRGTGDLLVVYLSCHGLIDTRRRLYFAAADTVKSRLASTGVEAQWLLEQMEDCRARRQVVILDCCFSGAFASGSKGEADLGLQERFSGQGRGRVVLTASRATEYSFQGEPVPGSAPVGSVFTAALVEGIRTGAADIDNDGYVSVEEAHAYAFDRVRATGSAQTPQRWLYGAEGSILLARSPAGIAITPAPLPETIRAGLDSPHPTIRLGAVTALAEWLTDLNPARTLAARQCLQEIAETEIPRIAIAARALLNSDPQSTPPAQTPDRADQPTHAPAAATNRKAASRLRTRLPALRPPAAPAVARIADRIRQRLPRLMPPRPRITLAMVVALLATSAILTASLRTPTRSTDQPPTPVTSRSPTRITGIVTGIVRTLPGLTGTVFGLAFSSDGKILATGGNDGTVWLWNPLTGEPIGQPLTDFAHEVYSVRFSPNGKMLAIGGRDKTVRLWNPTTGEPIGQPLTRHTDSVYSVAFSPDSKILASASNDKTVRLWNPATGKPIGQPLTGTTWINSVAFSPDGKILATSGGDGTVRLWDPLNGKPIGQPLTGHTGVVWSVAFSPDGKTLAAGCDDKTVRLWNPTTGKPIGQPLTGHHDKVYSVAFSPDGKILATGSRDGAVLLWNLATGQTFIRSTGPATGITNLAISPDGKILATGSFDHGVQLWEITEVGE